MGMLWACYFSGHCIKCHNAMWLFIDMKWVQCQQTSTLDCTVLNLWGLGSCCSSTFWFRRKKTPVNPKVKILWCLFVMRSTKSKQWRNVICAFWQHQWWDPAIAPVTVWRKKASKVCEKWNKQWSSTQTWKRNMLCRWCLDSHMEMQQNCNCMHMMSLCVLCCRQVPFQHHQKCIVQSTKTLSFDGRAGFMKNVNQWLGLLLCLWCQKEMFGWTNKWVLQQQQRWNDAKNQSFLQKKIFQQKSGFSCVCWSMNITKIPINCFLYLLHVLLMCDDTKSIMIWLFFCFSLKWNLTKRGRFELFHSMFLFLLCKWYMSSIRTTIVCSLVHRHEVFVSWTCTQENKKKQVILQKWTWLFLLCFVLASGIYDSISSGTQIQ